MGLSQRERRPRLVAHRGAGGQAPENTAAAIRRALALGIGVIEVDARVSRDGVVMLLHDATLERTTDGTGPVAARTAAELARLDAGGWYAARFAGGRVLTLPQALGLIDGRARVNIDIKTEAAIAPVLRLLDGSDWRDRVLISGCVAEGAKEVRRLDPAIDLLLNHGEVPADAGDGRAGWWAGFLAAATELGALGLNVDYRLVTAEFCAVAQRAGLQVWTYTIDDPVRYRAVAETGVDYITSNWPDRMLELLDGADD